MRYFLCPCGEEAGDSSGGGGAGLRIDVRVVPDLYDGLAWNAPVEYVGQFPTIPLHRKEFPIGTFLLKRVMDTTLSCLALIVGFPVVCGDCDCGQDEFAWADLLSRAADWTQGPHLRVLQVPHHGCRMPTR